MPSQVTNPETRDRYYIESLIEEAITSSQLEGASTTRRIAKEMFRSGRKTARSQRDHDRQQLFHDEDDRRLEN